jgi:histidine decarboxylase
MAVTTTESRLSAEDRQRLDDLYAMIRREAKTFVGYPCTALFDYSPLYRFLSYPVNNVGDPFVPSNFHLNTHPFEREVLGIFQQLTRAPADSFWGYVTSGGTEGNMYGIFLARELYPDGLVYFSEDTHYSVTKILRCLRVRNVMIKSEPDGRIDLEDLRETIKIHRDVPPIVFANVGTTMTGAVDDLEGICGILHDLAIPQHYIHADAALSGMILPFVEDPQPWDFRAGIDSISISGHKMIGSPIPCGVAVADKRNVDRIARRIEYVGTLDTTIAGSRNAVTVVFARPSAELVSMWLLAVQREVAHAITMPHVTRELIDRLVDDIANDTSDS